MSTIDAETEALLPEGCFHRTPNKPLAGLVHVSFVNHQSKNVKRSLFFHKLTKLSIWPDQTNGTIGTLGCGHIVKKALFPVRSTLVKFHRAILSSVVGDHMRNYGAAIFLLFLTSLIIGG